MLVFRKQKYKKGFSLLELVTVLAVMGTLAAVAVPAFNTVTGNSAEGALISSADGIVNSANSRAQSDFLDPARNTNINDIVLATPDQTDIEFLDGEGATPGVRVVGQQDLCINVELATVDAATTATRGEPYVCADGYTGTTPNPVAPVDNSNSPSATTPVTPTTVAAQLVPVAPTISSVFAGNLALTANFTASSSSSRPVSSISASISAGSYESSPVSLASSATSVSFSNLEADVIYTISITAINSAGQSTALATGTAILSPNQVSGVTATLTSPTAATVSWNVVPVTAEVPIDGYMVYVTSSDGTTTLVGLTTSTSLNVTGLTPGDTYTYSISAYNSGVEGGQSSPATLVVVTPPQPPVLGDSSLGNNSVTLTFSASSASTTSPVTSYKAYSGTTEVATLDAAATSYTFTELTPGETYDLSVVAVNISGVSTAATTSQVVYSTPGTPTGVSALFSSSSSSSVDLSWSTVSGAVGYTVYVLDNATDLYEVSGVSTSTQSTVTGLTPGTSYSFKVAAYSSALSGAQSSAVSATPGVFAPTLVSATAGDESVVLVWSHSDRPSITSYSVFSTASSTAVLSNISTAPQADGSYSVTVSGLAQGTSYEYYMKALDATRSSVASNSLSFTTTSSAPPAPVIYWSGLNTAQKVTASYVVDGVLVGPVVQVEDDVEDPQVCWVASPRAASYQVFAHNMSSNGVYQLSHIVSKPSSGWTAETCSNPISMVEENDYGVRVVAADSSSRQSAYSNTKEVKKGRSALRGEVTPAQPAVAAVAAISEIQAVPARAAVYGNRPTYTEDRGGWVSVPSTSWSPNVVTWITDYGHDAIYTYMEVQPPLEVEVIHVHEVRGVTWNHTHINLYPNMQNVLTSPERDCCQYASRDDGSWVTTYSNVWSPNVVTLGGEQYMVSAATAAVARRAPEAAVAYRPFVPAVIGIVRAKINNIYR